jgi:hypothetical protein
MLRDTERYGFELSVPDILEQLGDPGLKRP